MIDFIVYAVIGFMVGFTALVLCKYKNVKEHDIPFIVAFSTMGWPLIAPVAIIAMIFKGLDKLATRIANNLKARK